MTKKFLTIGGIIIVLIASILLVNSIFFGAPEPKSSKQEIFTVALKTNQSKIIDKLKTEGFIKNITAVNFVLLLKGKHEKIQPGGYYLSKSMNVFDVENKLTSPPDLKWVTIPEGLRKEQIGEILAKTFGWNNDELNKWNTIYTAMKFDYIEGVYFPDTYLIPVKENGLDIANRMIAHFNEKFAPYFDKFADKDIIWTTGLKLASIIQRETASKKDMPLISGILWNRLVKGIKLEVDATVQYAKGKTGDNWWAPPTPKDIQEMDSPYNTYKYKGLPPHPIASPGLNAIDASLNPVETDCIFYLHDKNSQMHCSVTYEEHKANIEKYLK